MSNFTAQLGTSKSTWSAGCGSSRFTMRTSGAPASPCFEVTNSIGDLLPHNADHYKIHGSPALSANELTRTTSVGNHTSDTVGETALRSFYGGVDAGNNNTGDNVVAIGDSAGENNTANESVLIGLRAGQNASGVGIAIGTDCAANVATNKFVAIGDGVLTDYTGSGFAYAIGDFAGEFAAGAQLILIGDRAGQNSTGGQLVLLGDEAGINATGDTVIGIGPDAAENATAGNLICIGRNTGTAAAGNLAIYIGDDAGEFASGAEQIFIGPDAGRNSSGAANIGIGDRTLTLSTSIHNIAIGNQVMSSATNGSRNFAAVDGAGRLSTGGSNHITIGWRSSEVFSGGAGIILGRNAGLMMTTGAPNIFIGNSAGGDVSTGRRNTVVGDEGGQGFAANSMDNVVIGYGAFGDLVDVADASRNTVVGYDAMGDHDTTTPDIDNNVVIGYGALNNYVEASDNIIIGYGQMGHGDGVGGRLDREAMLAIGYAGTPATYQTSSRTTIGGDLDQGRVVIGPFAFDETADAQALNAELRLDVYNRGFAGSNPPTTAYATLQFRTGDGTLKNFYVDENCIPRIHADIGAATATTSANQGVAVAGMGGHTAALAAASLPHDVLTSLGVEVVIPLAGLTVITLANLASVKGGTITVQVNNAAGAPPANISWGPNFVNGPAIPAGAMTTTYQFYAPGDGTAHYVQ